MKVLNLGDDRSVALLLPDDPVDMNSISLLDAAGRPVSAERPIKPAINPPDRPRTKAAYRHATIAPLSGAVFFFRLPNQVKDVSRPDAKLIPIPDAEYQIHCRPTLSYFELAQGQDALQVDPGQPPKYLFLRVPAVEMAGKISSDALTDNWIQKFAK